MNGSHPADVVNLEIGENERASAPLIRPIEPTPAERWGLAVSYVAAYIYVVAMMRDFRWIAAFAAPLCLGVEMALRGEKPRRESYVWLGCLWLSILCGTLGRANAWGDDLWLVVHAFGAYWLLTRAGRPVEGGTSRYLPVDCWHGLVAVPFMNLGMRLRVIKSSLGRGKGRLSLAAALGAIGAAIVAGLLFFAAGALLSEADANFARMLEGLNGAVGRLDDRPAVYLVLSLPVGAYLYALVFASRREPPESAEARGRTVGQAVASLRRVPAWVWPALLGAFSAMYILFFAVQFSYLFDGLRGLLPEAFTAAEYARRGFFELCGVMAVNFTLLGAASASAAGGLRACRASRTMAGLILALSALLAVTAASKLWLYVERFGLTPLRVQGAWLVAAMLAGCGFALRHLLTGRDSTGPWLLFAGVTLALTTLY